jgi:2,4-dienoyl-CoA reductase (NADPH2)
MTPDCIFPSVRKGKSRDLVDELRDAGVTLHLIGGADVAVELDAKRAIDQGTRLAVTI